MSCITIQTAYMKFVNVYGGCDYKVPSTIFKDLFQLKNKPLVSGDVNSARLLNETARKERDKEMIRNKRLLFSLDQFVLMFIEYPIALIFSNGHTTELSSKDFFSVPESVEHLFDNEFGSFYGHVISVYTIEFDQACHLFFNGYDDTLELPQDQKEVMAELQKNPKAFCCLELFNKNARGLMALLKRYPHEEAYKDDGEISVFLQKTYDISSTDANRHFLPILKNLKSF